jgi:hypothetical protein
VPFAVNVGAVATPLASVVTVDDTPPPVKVPLAPLDGAVNVTLTSGTGLPFASLTVTFRAVRSGVLTIERCGVPAFTVTDAGTLASFVSEKIAGAPAPATDAVTSYGPPAMLFAVKTADVATPLAFVVAVFTPFAKVPLGPVCAGAVNVTVPPASGCPPLSLTVAFKVAPNIVSIVALCGVPLVAVIEGDTVAVTVTLSDFVAVIDLASVTRTVKLLVPVPVGVPEIAPVLGASASPAGKVPDRMDQVYGVVPPVAASVAL